MRECSHTTRNLLVFFLVVAALAVYGLVTMQWLPAVLLIALVGAVVIFIVLPGTILLTTGT